MREDEHWSLGTTDVSQDGWYCVCAVDARGRVTYKAMRVRAGEQVSPGSVLRGFEGQALIDTGFEDRAGLLNLAEKIAREWEVEHIDGRFRSCGIFSDPLEWYPQTGRYHSKGGKIPRSPGCWHGEATRGCLTTVVRLAFPMEKRADGEGLKYYAYCDSSKTEWSIKYNGQSNAAPSVLPEGTLLAVFLALGSHQYNRYLNPLTDSVGAYAHLKVGTVLSTPNRFLARSSIPQDPWNAISSHQPAVEAGVGTKVLIEADRMFFTSFLDALYAIARSEITNDDLRLGIFLLIGCDERDALPSGTFPKDKLWLVSRKCGEGSGEIAYGILRPFLVAAKREGRVFWNDGDYLTNSRLHDFLTKLGLKSPFGGSDVISFADTSSAEISNRLARIGHRVCPSSKRES